MKYSIFGLLATLLSCSQSTRNDKQTVSKPAQLATDSIMVKQDSAESLNNSSSEVIGYKNDTIKNIEGGVSFIKNFYHKYLSSIDNGTSDEVKLAFCTPELIEQLSENDFSFDPFINAQDFDHNLLKTLKVKEDTTHKGQFIISYIDGYSKKKVSVSMKLKSFESGYKINDLKVIQ